MFIVLSSVSLMHGAKLLINNFNYLAPLEIWEMPPGQKKAKKLMVVNPGFIGTPGKYTIPGGHNALWVVDRRYEKGMSDIIQNKSLSPKDRTKKVEAYLDQKLKQDPEGVLYIRKVYDEPTLNAIKPNKSGGYPKIVIGGAAIQ